MKCILWSIPLLYIILLNPAFAADKIKNCNSQTETALEAVNDYITDHLNDFLQTDALFISTKHKDKVKKKWPKTTLKCANADNYCKNKGFDAFVSVGNVVRYCTKEINIPSANLCTLVGLTMHEMGHVAGIPRHNRHNHSNLYNQVSTGTADLVYRFGHAARDYCNTHPVSLSGSTSVIISAGEIGADCGKNSDCNSKKCQGKGDRRECVCKDNDDCPDDGRCKNRLGKNYCIAKGNGPGDFCKKNKDCDFGKCEKGNCVCKTDTDCRGFYGDTSMRCAKPATKKNFCQPTNQPLGESCQKNSDCSGKNKCKKKKCSS